MASEARTLEPTARLGHSWKADAGHFCQALKAEGETHYLAAEFIDGETLRDRLERAPLPLDEVLEIVAQAAQALAAAHSANTIHRDIKPENVMISEGRYRQGVGFGLAKLVESAPLASEVARRTSG